MSSKGQCGYCCKYGHSINRCKDPSIDELYQECIDVATFSLLGLMCNGYMMSWLNHLSLCQLRVLVYKSKAQKLIMDSSDREEHRKLLLRIHYWMRIKETKVSLDQKFELISDERFSGFIEDLINMYPSQKNQLLLLQSILRPPQIKFPIVPILAFNNNESSENDSCPICYENPSTIETNCHHSFCVPCVKKYFKSFNKKGDHICIPGCPMCRTKIATLSIPDSNLFNEFVNVYCK
jgi:Zinc finger, C3HC4 type (RING finger)